MAIRQIEQVSCSLNLGLIYSVSYSWDPQQGVSMTIFFVKENGSYQKPAYLQKVFIRLGSASFALYAVASKISLASGRRVMEVTFVDEFFMLEKYLVVLTGRGCGLNVFPLGSPVDRRTDAQKRADALDPTAQQIIDFTQFPDVEYTFNDFLTVLRSRFSVQVIASYNTTVTNAFTGTFKQVLDAWCSFFNFSFFFENGIIKVFNPVTLTIQLPAQPVDAIEYEDEEDARDTYGKTCFNWFQQEGGQFSLNQTSNTNGTLLTRTDTLFPVRYEFGLPQVNVDPIQVAASMYGEQFWFLYNYSKGSTAQECAWTPLTVASNLSISQSVGAIAGFSTNGNPYIASVNPTAMQAKFDAYQQYGTNIAGRYYLSNERSDLAIDQTFTWFDESNGQIFSFTNADDKTVSLSFLTPTNTAINVVPDTPINQFYSGVNYIGNRIVYRDNFPSPQENFVLTPTQTALINSTYQNLYNVKGSDGIDFNSELAPIYGAQNTYVAYQPQTLPQDLTNLFNGLTNLSSGFLPRYTSVPIKGIRTVDYSSLKASQSESDNVEVVNTNAGGTVVSNTAVIKTVKDGAYTVYYDKYAQCASANSANTYFQHRFDPRQISTDIAISFSFSKAANNTYTINRDFNTLNALVNNPLLATLAQPRSFVTRRVSYTVNYFKDVPGNFLTNGLVSMSISVAGDGVTCSYTFSNEVLQIPYREEQFNQFEQQIRNSWIRQYRPNQVIT